LYLCDSISKTPGFSKMAKKEYTPWQLVLLNFFRFLCLVIGAGIGVSYGMNLVAVIRSLINGGEIQDLWFQLLLNLYGIVFALLVVLIELRSSTVLDKHFQSMKDWGKRGFFYSL